MVTSATARRRAGPFHTRTASTTTTPMPTNAPRTPGFNQDCCRARGSCAPARVVPKIPAGEAVDDAHYGLERADREEHSCDLAQDREPTGPNAKK